MRIEVTTVGNNKGQKTWWIHTMIGVKKILVDTEDNQQVFYEEDEVGSQLQEATETELIVDKDTMTATRVAKGQVIELQKDMERCPCGYPIDSKFGCMCLVLAAKDNCVCVNVHERK